MIFLHLMATQLQSSFFSLQEKIKYIPDMVPPAGEAHPLAAFVVNPADHVSLDQDNWEDILNASGIQIWSSLRGWNGVERLGMTGRVWPGWVSSLHRILCDPLSATGQSI
jgi:hypothetical protein